MKKGKLIAIITAILLAAIYYYFALPAINIHSTGIWRFVLLVIAVVFGYMALKKRFDRYEMKHSKGIKAVVIAFAVVLVAFVVGGLTSAQIFNAKRYQRLLTVQESDFTTDIKEVSYDQIPILDKDSAIILGNRKMGSMVDMVSQFEVDDSIYSQINYQDKPVRVSPLRYANVIKWISNQSEGIPAYIKIDMATQTTELVKLGDGIKYSSSEYFNRNIYRHLRFRYPTYIFDSLSFEISEEGIPYWICPVKKFNIGLFGGQTIGKVVLCNAITGETEECHINDVPQWVDRVYNANLLIKLYDYHGTLKHGFWNSVLSQKDCLVTTEGYNYLAIDDDVWVYTGVTSVNGDQSNVGFVLMNQRTMETKYYKIEGATETSAMASAEGQVQNLKYVATFPLLLNINGEPTYFIALKDNAGLVKKYAMVNVQKYQVVAIGDTVSECEKEYQRLLLEGGIQKEEVVEKEVLTITGKIAKIVPATVEGNSHYYILLEGQEGIFDVVLVQHIDIIRYEVGQEITLEYHAGTDVFAVQGIQ